MEEFLDFCKGKSIPVLIQELTNEPYFVKIKRDSGYLVFSYDQIKTPTKYGFLHACRGLITNQDLKIVCMSFIRFFNHHETCSAQIDWNSPSLTIQDKVDGSLIRFWKDPLTNEIRISSRNCVDANSAMLPSARTVGELVKEVITEEQMRFIKVECEKNRTVVCELWHPDNRVVCEYKTPGLWLLTVFDNKTYQEIQFSTDVFLTPKPYPLDSLNGLLYRLKSEDEKESDLEGYVVSDGKNRIKIKSLRYVMRHQIGFKHPTKITDDDIVKAILLDVSDDIPGIETQVEHFKNMFSKVFDFLSNEKMRMEAYSSSAEYFRNNKHMGKIAGILKKFQKGIILKEILLETKTPAEILKNLSEQSVQ